MPTRRLFTALVVVVSTLTLPTPVYAAPIVEFSEESNLRIPIDGTNITAVAQAFSLPFITTVGEVQLRLQRRPDASGAFQIELLDDSNGSPGGHRTGAAVFVEDLPYDAPGYVSFHIGGAVGHVMPAGTYWIKAESDDYAEWYGKLYNPYGEGGDTRASAKDPPTWEKRPVVDLNFKVFGTGQNTPTILTLTSSDDSVTIGGMVTLTATVQAGGLNIVGAGTVTFNAADGTFPNGNTFYTMDIFDGVTKVQWTAPSETGEVGIDATFNGYTHSGAKYLPDSDTVSVDVVTRDITTTTEITSIDPASTTTYNTVTVTVTVQDANLDNVSAGTVIFTDSSTEGSFSPAEVSVVDGQASTTWNTPSTETGTFVITASYSHDGTGPLAYGPSSYSDTIDVDYTERSVNITLNLSPTESYISGIGEDRRVWAEVIVTDSVSGNQVPGVAVNMTHDTPDGYFEANPLPIPGGANYAVFHTPTSPQNDVEITAAYPQTEINGYRYFTNYALAIIDVVVDDDDEALELFGEWIEDYPTNEWDLDNGHANLSALADVLESVGFQPTILGNANAKEVHWKSTGQGGHENDYVDKRDISYYHGHGHPDSFTFGYWGWDFWAILDHSYLKYDEAYGAWGDGDLEWMAFNTCHMMSDDHWTLCMNGLHMLLGSRTVMKDTETMGPEFADLIAQTHAGDPPLNLVQAWQIAYDSNNDANLHPKIYAEDSDSLDDYLWGQGHVRQPDPVVDDYYFAEGELQQPRFGANVAHGGPYTAMVGVPITLDASGTTHNNSDEYLTFIWDLDRNTNNPGQNYDGGGDLDDDDGDAFGPRPTVTFDSEGSRPVRLMVFDSHHVLQIGITSINVISAAASANNPPPPPPTQIPWDLMVFDNTGGVYPDETELPLLMVFPTEEISFGQMESIGEFWAMNGSANEGQSGTWSWTSGVNRLFVNRYSYGIRYLDATRAYRYLGTPPALPTDQEATDAVMAFMGVTGTQMDTFAFEPVMTVSRLTGDRNEPTPTEEIPYLKRVAARRVFQIGQKTYPVVGAGGKVEALVDEAHDVVYFLKIWREVVPYGSATLVPADIAVLDLMDFKLNALIGKIPPTCHTIEVNAVSLAYYEEGFSKLQQMIYPVYVLDVKAIDDYGMVEMELYVSATNPVLMSHVTSPPGEVVLKGCNGTVNLEAMAHGGDGGPYTFQWYSDFDGLLGEGPAIAADLSMPDEGEYGRTHTVSVEVTDASGNSDKSFVKIQIICIPPDFNGDGYVDPDDYAIFEACATGPDIPYDPDGLPAGCTVEPDPDEIIPPDFDHDHDIDHEDFGTFQNCYSGENIAADPECFE